MKRVRFRDPAGSVRRGTWTDGTITAAARTHDPDAVDVLPPSEPTKVVGVPGNHVTNYDDPDEVPEEPGLFLKPPNCLAGHRDTLTLPVDEEEIIYEGELGVVIGDQCRNVAAADAPSVVAGYTALNDVTRHVPGGSVRAKAFDNSVPVGPVLATPDEVPADATIETRVNGERRQRGPRTDLVFDAAEIIETVTAFLTLEPGDVIATGTPESGAPLANGDRVEVAIDGIGTLAHEVRAP